MIDSARPRNAVVLVCGASGSGKSFLIERAIESGLPFSNLNMIDFGKALFESLKQTTQVGNQDELTNLPHEVVKREALRLTADLLHRQPLLLITHAVYFQGTSIVTNPHILLTLFPSCIIHVRADPQVILWRRRNDFARGRPPSSIFEIGLCQELEARTLSLLSDYMGCDFFSIDNRHDNLGVNVTKLREAISTVLNADQVVLRATEPSAVQTWGAV